MKGGTAWTTNKKARKETKSSEPLILVTIVGEESAGKEKMSTDDPMVAKDPPIERSAPIIEMINKDNSLHGTSDTANTIQAPKKVPFPGRTRVWCGGKLITSAWTSWLWITFLVILVPLIVFFVLVLPDFITTISVFTLIPLFVLMPLSLASSLVTAWTDPGILPRNINPTATLRLYGATDYGDDQMISRLVFHDQNPDFLLGKEMVIGGQRVFLKYCTTCQIFRPPRCTHCSYCDNCVEEFDHHCPWVSNCVGRRNYRYFMHFLIFTDLLCLYAFALMAVYIYRVTKGDLFGGWQPGYSFAAAFGIAVYTGLLAIPVTGILVYHLFITAKHVTTNEQIKMQRAAASGTNADIVIARNSCPRNYLHTFCLPRPTPVVSWRSYKSSRRTNTS